MARHAALAVAALTLDDGLDLTGDWYSSPTVRDNNDNGSIDMLELSLTRSPATVGLRPVTVLDGDFRSGSSRERWGRQRSSSMRIEALLERAADAAKLGGPILVHTAAPTEIRTDTQASRIEYRPVRRIEHSAHRGDVLSVH